jgi:putative transposase
VQLGLSERRATRLIGVARASVRYHEVVRSKDAELLAKLRQIKEEHPRFGVPRVMALLKSADVPSPGDNRVNHKRIERLWRIAGLQVARRKRQKRPSRPDRVEAPCKAERPNHVWTYDFIEDALLDGRKIRILNILDEFTREWVAVKAGVSMSAKAVVNVLAPLFQQQGAPMFVRSDNGGEFIATEVKEALKAAGASPAYIEPGSPWQNGFVESFHGKLRDEFLDQETFLTIKETQICLEQRRRFYNEVRPHSALRYMAPSAFRQQWTENQQKQEAT